MTYNLSETASLFTDLERATHLITERGLVSQAKVGNIGQLYAFWAVKKDLFMKRTALRNPYKH